MGLERGTPAQGPPAPGATGVASGVVTPALGPNAPADYPDNQYAAQNLISRNVAAHYKMRARLMPVCDRKFQSEFGSELSMTGDTMQLRRMQMFESRTGIAWDPQPQLEELYNLSVREVHGIQTQEEWNTAGVYRDAAYASASKIAEKENLAYKVDAEVADAWAMEYQGGVVPRQRVRSSTGTVQSEAIAPAGKDNEPHGLFPDNLLLAWIQGELQERGIQDRKLVCAMDNYTSTSLGRTALFTQQYKEGAASAVAQSKGSIDGQMVGGWQVFNSATNGRQQLGSGAAALTLNGTLLSQGPSGTTRPIHTRAGLDRLTLTGTNNHVIPRGTKISIQGLHTVNPRTKDPMATLSQHTVIGSYNSSGVLQTSADPQVASSAVTVAIFPPMRFGPDQETSGRSDMQKEMFRRSNVSTDTIASGAQVFLWAGGPAGTEVDFRNTYTRTAINGARCSRTFLVADMSTQVIWTEPYVDPLGSVSVKKNKLEGSGLAYCVAVDAELKEKSTYYDIWTRFGIGVAEYEAGFVSTGARAS